MELRNGEHKQYHENGCINSINNYVDGLRHGVNREFYDNGQLSTLSDYV